jgi:hypothetical protein
MKESQMFAIDRKLQIAQKKYWEKRRYEDILKEMLEECNSTIIGLNIDSFLDEYIEKLLKIK